MPKISSVPPDENAHLSLLRILNAWYPNTLCTDEIVAYLRHHHACSEEEATGIINAARRSGKVMEIVAGHYRITTRYRERHHHA